MPAPPAKATFMASSVPSMMQEIHVMKNDYWQWFGARKYIFLLFCLAIIASPSISLSNIFIPQLQEYWFIYYPGGMIKSLHSFLFVASNIDDI